MRNQIIEDLKIAMKNQDKKKLSVIRMVKGAIQMEELNAKRELEDQEVIGIIAKQIKTRRESITEFEKGNRNDLIESTLEEIKILEEYMPEQLSQEEVNAIIEEAFKTVNPTNPRDTGKIMGIITPKLKGKADMSEVSKIVKEKLGNS